MSPATVTKIVHKMRNKRQLLLEQLDQKLKPFLNTRDILVPERGWIHAIRTTLNMTMAQLGYRLGITRQGVKRIEESEAKGTITLNSLKEAAHAMEMRLVYGFVPKNGTIDDLIEMKAEELAHKIVLRTNQNMKLEDQGIGDDKILKSIQELTAEFKREVRRSIWD